MIYFLVDGTRYTQNFLRNLGLINAEEKTRSCAAAAYVEDNTLIITYIERIRVLDQISASVNSMQDNLDFASSKKRLRKVYRQM